MSRDFRAVEVVAQAKINLRLRILARESSGFHQLETLFLRLDLGDTVRVRRSVKRSLDVLGDIDVAALGPPERNLAWRAADAYRAASGQHDEVAIEIEKRIPIGGGLGGGSADAGAVLRCLDAMSPEPLGEPGLLSIAAALGSDVPFLTSGHAYALAWGRGERMLSLEPPERRQVMILIPAVSVNTKAAYGWLSDARAQAGGSGEASVLDATTLSSWASIASLAFNDFEPIVAARHHEVRDVLVAIRQVPIIEMAMMSGSGSSVFGIVESGAHHIQPGGEGTASGLHLMTMTATRVEPARPID